MRATSRSTLLVGLPFIGLGAHAAWPIKTIDLANFGDDCDPATEQYLEIEAFDFHDHPKFTLRWRQITGPCGEAIDDSEARFVEAFYDGSAVNAEDDPPTNGDSGWVQLSLLVCSPFGEYEIDLDVESFSDKESTLQQRTSWQIKNGPAEYPIWDTVTTDLAIDERYSPTVPGKYTWPLKGITGYYSTIVAGPLPPLDCASSVPAGTRLVGCFADSKADRLLNSSTTVRAERGPGGMTAEICSDFCSGYDFFGLEFASECFCGTVEEFEDSVASEQCGLSYESLCTGDPTTACGGWNAISVYQKTDFAMVGCFQDDHAFRLMKPKGSAAVMSSAICYKRCNDGTNTHFGTQYGSECWCAVDAMLVRNGEELATDECDMLCEGTTTGERCGGWYKMTAYEIDTQVTEGYIGCYADTPYWAIDAEEDPFKGNMTNEVCISYCAGNGHTYAGTQRSVECWCGNSYGLFGIIPDSHCSYPCEGDVNQMCGGSYALSVYSTA